MLPVFVLSGKQKIATEPVFAQACSGFYKGYTGGLNHPSCWIQPLLKSFRIETGLIYRVILQSKYMGNFFGVDFSAKTNKINQKTRNIREALDNLILS